MVVEPKTGAEHNENFEQAYVRPSSQVQPLQMSALVLMPCQSQILSKLVGNIAST